MSGEAQGSKPIIRSFGLHWHVDRVFWGSPAKSGCLLGGKSRSSRTRQIDFREQRGIYALYADYELVYVGQTGGAGQRLLKRLKDHRKDHLAERWNRFSWFGTQHVKKIGDLSGDTVAVHSEIGAALNILEAVATAIAEPRLNLQRGRWGDAAQYFQLTAPGSRWFKLDAAQTDGEEDESEE